MFSLLWCPRLVMLILLFGEFLYALELAGWFNIKNIPSTYFQIPTENVLRCGSLCEKQGLCTAATFDYVDRMCHMHVDDTRPDLTRTKQRYLYKIFQKNRPPYDPESTCDGDTQIPLPSTRDKAGYCYRVDGNGLTNTDPVQQSESTISTLPKQDGSISSSLMELHRTTSSSLMGEDGTALRSPVEEDETTSSSPVEEDGTTLPRPVEEDETTSPSPVEEDGTTSPSPVKEDGTTSPSPVEEDGTTSPSPVKEDGTISLSPVAETGTTSPSPMGEAGTTSPSPMEEAGTTSSSLMEQDGTTSSILDACPAKYTVHVTDKKNYCLKLVDWMAPRKDATAGCQADGGHLLTIDSEAVHEYMMSYMQGIGMGSCWIDGEDFLLKDQMLTWDMKVLPYQKWARDEPDGRNENCLTLSKADGYMFADALCDNAYYYICQLTENATETTTETTIQATTQTTTQTTTWTTTENETQTTTQTTAVTQPTVNASEITCPSKYDVHEIDNKTYCLKFSTSQASRENAAADCLTDGGHLMTIDSEAVHTYIISYLQSINRGSHWIDGYDFLQNNQMLTWDMKVLPYIKWGSDEPDGGAQDCLRLSETYNYVFRDTGCDYEFSYICQITQNTTQAITQTAILQPVKVCANLYTEHIIDGRNYCLKLMDVLFNKDDAMDNCEAEGAHLVTIENEAMHMYIKAYLENITSASRWIDGEEYTTTGGMLTWNMKPLPYAGWAPDQPDGGDQKCIKLSRTLQYYYRDTACDRTEYSICQLTYNASVTTTISPPTTSGFSCPTTYTGHDISGTGYCLRFGDTEFIRNEAMADCQNDGGHLMTVDSYAVHLYIKTYLQSIDSGSRWIDGQDLFSNDTMLTWDGEPITYTNWSFGEPSDGEDDCLQLSQTNEYLFKDGSCLDLHLYICQID